MQTAYLDRRNDLSTPQAIYNHSIRPEHNCDIGQHLPTLRKLAIGNIVEIGVRGGSSTAAFILGLRDCTCGHEQGLHSNGYCYMYNVGCQCQEFKAKAGHLWSLDVNPLCGTEVFEPGMPEWTFLHANSTLDWDRVRRVIPTEIDILFLDGEHNYEQVIEELDRYGPLVNRGGLILMHDIELTDEEAKHAGLRYLPGVRRAALEYGARTGGRLEIQHGSYGLGIMRIPLYVGVDMAATK